MKDYYRDMAETSGESKQGVLATPALKATSSCLVCLSLVRRTEAVWSCEQCFCILHLQCIQQWARDGVKQASILSEELFPQQDILWSCPKCRKEHKQADIPKEYTCFCKKMVDPPVDPWLMAHCCGSVCDKLLQPECGHHCVLLCHPGACPPCPQTIHIACYCGQGAPVLRRCGSRGWSCGCVCGKGLTCGKHRCGALCHMGVCDPCDRVAGQSCVCGCSVVQRPCNSPPWHCPKPCGKPLSCGYHVCEKVCHGGPCGVCPRTLLRNCPCGKVEHTIPCVEEVPVCGDTCNKPLACGEHLCIRSCHYGDCGQCMQTAIKQCRCGKKTKSLPCTTEYLCETKCTKLKQCGIHQCKRKCCDGSCPPCEQVCGKTLGCKKHKCAAPCHPGRCYPCVLTANVSCRCGQSIVTVACGSEQAAKPPKCRELCLIPPTCHHSEKKIHHCHFGNCPPCQLTCGMSLPCGHHCTSTCHTEPKAQERTPGLAPWVKDTPTMVVQPCPPCLTMVTRACKGEHETNQFPCSETREYLCGRTCGRRLSCGNHSCGLECHAVFGAPGAAQAGENCQQCEEGCERPRPPGCTHPCHLPCHAGDCPPCNTLMKMKCYCGTTKMINCRDWISADEAKKIELLSCSSQCTRLLLCGHCCPLLCHPGDCPPASSCKRKVTLRCPCKRIKKVVRCFEKELPTSPPPCDKECLKIQREKEEAVLKEQAEMQLAEEKRLQAEQEEISRLLRPKGRRRKPRPEMEEEEPSFYQRHKKSVYVATGGTTLLVAVFALWLYNVLNS